MKKTLSIIFLFCCMMQSYAEQNLYDVNYDPPKDRTYYDKEVAVFKEIYLPYEHIDQYTEKSSHPLDEGRKKTELKKALDAQKELHETALAQAIQKEKDTAAAELKKAVEAEKTRHDEALSKTLQQEKAEYEKQLAAAAEKEKNRYEAELKNTLDAQKKQHETALAQAIQKEKDTAAAELKKAVEAEKTRHDEALSKTLQQEKVEYEKQLAAAAEKEKSRYEAELKNALDAQKKQHETALAQAIQQEKDTAAAELKKVLEKEEKTRTSAVTKVRSDIYKLEGDKIKEQAISTLTAELTETLTAALTPKITEDLTLRFTDEYEKKKNDELMVLRKELTEHIYQDTNARTERIKTITPYIALLVFCLLAVFIAGGIIKRRVQKKEAEAKIALYAKEYLEEMAEYDNAGADILEEIEQELDEQEKDLKKKALIQAEQSYALHESNTFFKTLYEQWT